MELADYLIWGALIIIVLRLLLPPILTWLGLPITKKSKRNDQ